MSSGPPKPNVGPPPSRPMSSDAPAASEHEHAEADGERPRDGAGRAVVALTRGTARCSRAADSMLRGNPHDHSADGTVTVRCAAPSRAQRRMLEHGVRERRLRAAIAGQHDELGRAAQQRLHRQAAPAVETLLGRDVAQTRKPSSSCASESAPTVKPPGRTMTVGERLRRGGSLRAHAPRRASLRSAARRARLDRRLPRRVARCARCRRRTLSGASSTTR